MSIASGDNMPDPLEWTTFVRGGGSYKTIHIIPEGEEHLYHEECSCWPDIQFIHNGCLMIHRSFVHESQLIEAYEVLYK